MGGGGGRLIACEKQDSEKVYERDFYRHVFANQVRFIYKMSAKMILQTFYFICEKEG